MLIDNKSLRTPSVFHLDLRYNRIWEKMFWNFNLATVLATYPNIGLNFVQFSGHSEPNLTNTLAYYRLPYISDKNVFITFAPDVRGRQEVSSNRRNHFQSSGKLKSAILGGFFSNYFPTGVLRQYIDYATTLKIHSVMHSS